LTQHTSTGPNVTGHEVSLVHPREPIIERLSLNLTDFGRVYAMLESRECPPAISFCSTLSFHPHLR